MGNVFTGGTTRAAQRCTRITRVLDGCVLQEQYDTGRGYSGSSFNIYDAGLPGIFVCHCSICRRSTGSSGIAVVVLPKERFRWIRGEDFRG